MTGAKRHQQNPSLAGAPSPRAHFLEWAQRALIPLSISATSPDEQGLAAVGNLMGEARVVCLSEAIHGAAEPLALRNRLFQYLVENQGFTAIALESGMVEARTVHDYVRGTDADLSTVLAQGLSWSFDQLPHNRALVRWLREYNADPQHVRKINFYGFDVPGSPGESGTHRGMETALSDALQYLHRVDRVAAAEFYGRTEPFLRRIRFDPRELADVPAYDRLSRIERDTLTASITDLITLLERRERPYTAASTHKDYRWAYRAAIGARQVDAFLRQIPIDWARTGDVSQLPSFLSMASDVRDRAQADNVEWILREEGSDGKVLVFGHRYHLSATPITPGWYPTPPGESPQQEVAGTYLRRRWGQQVLTIGNLVGYGAVACGPFKQTLQPPAPDSLDGVLGELHTPCFALDLRDAPEPLAHWLQQEHALGQGNEAVKLAASQGFDVLLYMREVTPACSAAPSGAMSP